MGRLLKYPRLCRGMFIGLQKNLGLKLTIMDKNLNKIEGRFDSMSDLLRNPEFIARLNQTFYVSNVTEATWFKLTIRKGKLLSTNFLLSMKTS